MKPRISFLAFLIWGPIIILAQVFPEKGMPLLRNYSPAQYQNKGKVWDIRSAPNGLIYMAADRGLLKFDGKSWSAYSGSAGFTRSVLVVNDSLIFTGSDLDFGVWTKNKFQSLEYTSLYPFRSDAQEISEEFWDIHLIEDNVIFISSQNLYIYKKQQLTRISAPGKFTGSFSVNETLYIADEKNGLYVLDKWSLVKLFDFPEGQRFEISGIYQHNQGLVIVSRNAGLYLYASGNLSALETPFSQILKTANVFSFERLSDSHLAFGTVLSGLFITDTAGNIIHRINRYKGLPSNTILSTHYSPCGKLWVGTDYGLSSLYLENNITYFYDYRGDVGTGYAASIIDDAFYLGTNQGLYRTFWDHLSNDMEFTQFELVPGTEGQVWTLESIDNTLFIGHDQGLLRLKNGKPEKINHSEGVWTIVPYKDYLLTGSYNGISIFRESGGEWTFVKKMELILGSCNQLVFEENNVLWVNIPNFGVIRAVLDENLVPVERLIFPDSLFIEADPFLLFKDGQIHLLAGNRKFTWNALKREFVLQDETIHVPTAENILSGIYQSANLHTDYDFYPVYNGFALKFLRFAEESASVHPSLIFRKISAYSNDEITAVYPEARLPFKLNNLNLEFIVPNREEVFYQHKLNESGRWSDWSKANTAGLIGLGHSDYTFYVRAMIEGNVIAQQAFSFRIAAPWYRTWYAYGLYFIVLLALVFSIRYWQKISLKKQKKNLLVRQQTSLRQQAEKHREKILILEQEKMKAEFEQMKQQLKSKTVELANKAKDNEDKNRLLLSLKEKFDQPQDEPHISKIRMGEIRRMLDTYLRVDDKTFEIQMDELHQEFFKKLKDKFPTLSNNDLRLCAYLRVGLNSKEIAEILNIQPSSSYISRSRLRKKLNLKPEQDLYGFLNTI
jgi:AraC family transcriptional regulator, chitin signaling transcriptional activator